MLGCIYLDRILEYFQITMDPEGGNYPLARTISLGLQLKF